MSGLKSRLLFSVLRTQLGRELSTACSCLTRSRFDLAGNFRYCLQQNDEQTYAQPYNRHGSVRPESNQRKKRHVQNQQNYNNHWDEDGNETVNDSHYNQRGFSQFDRSGGDREARTQKQYPRKWQDRNEHQLASPFKYRDTPVESNSFPEPSLPRADDGLRTTDDDLPVIEEPIMRYRPPDVPTSSEKAYPKKKKKQDKYRITGVNLSEEEVEAHRKQFPSKKKRIDKISVEIAINGEILFGIHPVLLALKARYRSFHNLYLRDERPGDDRAKLQEICELASQANIPVSFVPVKILRQLSGDRPHQGVCLDASVLQPEELKWSDEESVPCNPEMPNLWVMVNSIVDPMNLGAVLRSSYYFGVNRILTTRSSCRLSPIVSKASSGALELFPPFLLTEVESFLKAKISKGWDVVGTCVGSQTEQIPETKVCSVTDHTLVNPTILIIGNEGRGLDPELSELCSLFLTIYPGRQQNEKIAALNVGVAAGIILNSLLGRRVADNR